eukprot:CAMPEP_0119123522 /NCGR_PEP_ID=MMETSP1310-20130426/3447_1 /TAXON_ID=464262 /ORGANISM="Genus nov. species nov., Strain RCC2339" /LENGTH=261 /DNA_ID=CAMNT_0007113359 /DNA_START=57 /DNA_END=843 /DNA_ORIENTATION=+
MKQMALEAAIRRSGPGRAPAARGPAAQPGRAIPKTVGELTSALALAWERREEAVKVCEDMQAHLNFMAETAKGAIFARREAQKRVGELLKKVSEAQEVGLEKDGEVQRLRFENAKLEEELAGLRAGAGEEPPPAGQEAAADAADSKPRFRELAQVRAQLNAVNLERTQLYYDVEEANEHIKSLQAHIDDLCSKLERGMLVAAPPRFPPTPPGAPAPPEIDSHEFLTPSALDIDAAEGGGQGRGSGAQALGPRRGNKLLAVE